VRIFLDECVDWRLSRDITGHDSDIRRLVPELLSKLDSARPGAVTIVG